MHIPVLLNEVIENLSFEDKDVYLDATLGAGGHMEEIYKRFGKSVALVGIDADETAASIARERLELLGAQPKIAVLNFRNIDKVPELLGVETPNKILFDLGWNSMQVEESGRGFSFNRDEPLQMTFAKDGESSVFTAYDVVNKWEEENIADVIYGYGEEKHSRKIARAIVEARAIKPITTSLELAENIKQSVGFFYRISKIHPATRTFQAIRIAVNDELETLKVGLEKAFEIVKVGGRIGVISFHSLEDRIVKNFFKKMSDENNGVVLTKKPIIATDQEIKFNPRSRSAKLRVIKK